MHTACDLDGIQSQVQLQEDSNNSGSDSDAAMGDLRAATNSQTTLPQQTRSRTKSLTPALESNALARERGKTEDVSDSDSEPDVGLIITVGSAESTLPASQNRTQHRKSSPKNSECTPPPTPIVVVEEHKPAQKPPASKTKYTVTLEDRDAADVLANLSNGHSNSLLGRQEKQMPIPCNDSQAPQRSELMIVDEPETFLLPHEPLTIQQQSCDKAVPPPHQGMGGFKRKPSTASPVSDPQAVQPSASVSIAEFENAQLPDELFMTQPQIIPSGDQAVKRRDAMIEGELESQSLEPNSKRRRSKNVPDRTSKSDSEFRRYNRKMAGLKDKNKNLISINQEQSKTIHHELSEKTAILNASQKEILVAEQLRNQLIEERKEGYYNRQKIQVLTLQVKQLEEQIEREKGWTDSSTKHERIIKELSARLEETDADHRATIAENTAEIRQLKSLVENQEAEARELLFALESERDELSGQIEELNSRINELSNRVNKEGAKATRYRALRDEKTKELEGVRWELKSARQELQKNLESARDKEEELIARAERYRVACNQKTKELEGLNAGVNGADEELGKKLEGAQNALQAVNETVQGLRKELEFLKSEHARAIIQKDDQLAAMHQKYVRRFRGKEDLVQDTEDETFSVSGSRPTFTPPSLTQQTGYAPPMDTRRQSKLTGSTAITTFVNTVTPAKAKDIGDISPTPCQYSGTSTTPPQGGPSAIPCLNDHKAKIPDAELEVQRQRSSATPEMRTGFISTAPLRGRDEPGRIAKHTVNDGSRNGKKVLQQPANAHIVQNPQKKLEYAMRLNPAKVTLEEEKKKDTDEDRLLFCSIVRETVLSAFGLKKTEEYAFLDAADRKLVNDFNTKDQGSGPNRELPEIDMDGQISSPWNVRLIKLLAETAIASYQNVSGLRQLPVRSQLYYEDLVKDHIDRAKTAWRKLQPQELPLRQGTPEEIRNRLVDKRWKARKFVG